MNNAAKSLRNQRVSQRAFMVVRRVPLGMWENVRELSVGRREGKGDGICNEGDRRVRVKRDAICDKRSRPRKFPDRSHVADT